MARRRQEMGYEDGPAGSRRYGADGHRAHGEDTRAFEGGERLTRREREVAWLLSEGWRPKQIAERLTISVETARTHIKHICGKLNVSGMLAAVAEARRLGLLAEPSSLHSPTRGGAGPSS